MSVQLPPSNVASSGPGHTIELTSSTSSMLPAGKIVAALYHKLQIQSSAPDDGWNYRPKHVELIGIINKPLLLHPFGCIYYILHRYWYSIQILNFMRICPLESDLFSCGQTDEQTGMKQVVAFHIFGIASRIACLLYRTRYFNDRVYKRWPFLPMSTMSIYKALGSLNFWYWQCELLLASPILCNLLTDVRVGDTTASS
jgi:hypothetical protein